MCIWFCLLLHFGVEDLFCKFGTILDLVDTFGELFFKNRLHTTT